MIELTNADYEKIREVCSAGHRSGTYPMIADEREAIYRAGLVAGIERAAKKMEPESTNTAITIRALLKEQR